VSFKPAISLTSYQLRLLAVLALINFVNFADRQAIPPLVPLIRDEFALTAHTSIGLYNPQRCIVDAFRLRHLEGLEPAVEALRRWLRRRGSQPAELLAMARAFPKAEPGLRSALEILL